MPILTRRWNDPPHPEGEGLRVLVTRYRPRGVSKADETWDRWIPALGPSPALLAAVDGKGREAIAWSTYKIGYLKEMRGAEPQRQIAELAGRVARGETVTLICSARCVREARCHRSLLKSLIESAPEAGTGTAEG